MRLLGVLALVTPVMVGILLLSDPELTASWVASGYRPIVAAVTAVSIGVALTSLICWTIVRIRFGRLTKAAERIVAGDYAVAVSERGGGLEARLARAINGIAASLADTHDRATFDRLTGVANRQALLAALFAEVERASRYERPLCVAFVDIDHFKTVNDSYGHAAGDIVLRGVAQTIAENLRASDLIGRYGGEEFMLILTETMVEEGAALSEKLRKLVERSRFTVEGNPELSVTISIGIVGGVGKQLRMEHLVRDADAAMYSAKSLGRNQTYIFEEPDEESRVPRAPISDAGRARAVEIGRQAREAATDILTSHIAPLPHYRGQPSALIASIVTDMARRLELPEGEIDRIRVAALLHDVGKVAVPESILDKPAALTPAEWRTVIQHPRIGQVILEHAAALRDAVPIILHHHERFGGHGYPYGLRANEIPLGARIVSIADAYDAMIHDRPYKRAMSHDAAVAELRQHAGTQFDPELVVLFCDLYADRPPAPDPTVVSMVNAPSVPPALPSETPAIRRDRRRQEIPSSATMAAEGHGIVDLDATRRAVGRSSTSADPVDLDEPGPTGSGGPDGPTGPGGSEGGAIRGIVTG